METGNDSGYVPLVVALACHWDKPLAELPADLAERVQLSYTPLDWDSLGPDGRRSIAAQCDYRDDPRHEASTYFLLWEFADDIAERIDRARMDGKDSVALALLDVAKQINSILEADRSRVGAEIQALRKSACTSQNAARGPRWPNHVTKKLEALRLAALRFWGDNYDPAQPDTAPKNEVVAEWLQTAHGIGATPATEMASILRPDTLRTGPR
ncbi:MAG: hypothetical protein RR101_14170 [Burkholderiaceae bacterium]